MPRTSMFDRRSGEDRRKAHDLDYLLKGGVERRHTPERRCQHVERRSDWIMLDRWRSIALGLITRAPHIALDETQGEAGLKMRQMPRKALRNRSFLNSSFPEP
jgi:hypothetical protein